MVKKLALLIGINYVGTSSALNGCINDVKNMKTYLVGHLGYQESGIRVMTDDSPDDLKPTKQNIFYQLNKFLLDAYHQRAREIFVHYSGHGSRIYDQSGDEKDGYDEVIVPLDYSKSGLITDDTLHDYFRKVPRGCRCVCLFDSCNSGTVLDLKYRYIGGRKNVIENRKSRTPGNIITISGCRDDQTSADAWINGAWAGAMTSAFLYAMNSSNHQIKCYKLLKDMRKKLKNDGYTQVPQICCAKRLGWRTYFSIKGRRAGFIRP